MHIECSTNSSISKLSWLSKLLLRELYSAELSFTLEPELSELNR